MSVSYLDPKGEFVDSASMDVAVSEKGAGKLVKNGMSRISQKAKAALPEGMRLSRKVERRKHGVTTMLVTCQKPFLWISAHWKVTEKTVSGFSKCEAGVARDDRILPAVVPEEALGNRDGSTEEAPSRDDGGEGSWAGGDPSLRRYYEILKELPKDPWEEGEVMSDRLRARLDRSPLEYWACEEIGEVLADTEERAEALADFLEHLCGYGFCTCYYDPEVDRRNGEADCLTGWWAVYPEE